MPACKFTVGKLSQKIIAEFDPFDDQLSAAGSQWILQCGGVNGDGM
jgi:hypothetical protein